MYIIAENTKIVFLLIILAIKINKNQDLTD